MEQPNIPLCTNVEELEKIQLGNNVTAGWFLHGICGVFALELHKKFGYEIEVVTESPSATVWQHSIIHIYCKSGKRYIDARGVFLEKNLLLKEFEDFFDTPGFISIASEELKEFLLCCMSKSELQSFSLQAEKLIELQDNYS